MLDDLSTGHRDAVPDRAPVRRGRPRAGGGRGARRGIRRRAALRRQVAGRRERAAARAVLARQRRDRRRACSTRCVDHGTPRLVFSSTAATYGEPEQVPIREDAPTRPTNPYGASKLAIDHAIGSYARAHGLAATSLRYFNVAGAHGRVRRAPRGGDPPHPARAAGRARAARQRRRSSATTGRPRTGPASATTSTSTTWPRPTCSRSADGGARRARDLQPRQRQRLLGAARWWRRAGPSPGTRSRRSRPPARRRPRRARGLQRGGDAPPWAGARRRRTCHDRRRRVAVHAGAPAGLTSPPAPSRAAVHGPGSGHTPGSPALPSPAAPCHARHRHGRWLRGRQALAHLFGRHARRPRRAQQAGEPVPGPCLLGPVQRDAGERAVAAQQRARRQERGGLGGLGIGRLAGQRRPQLLRSSRPDAAQRTSAASRTSTSDSARASATTRPSSRCSRPVAASSSARSTSACPVGAGSPGPSVGSSPSPSRPRGSAGSSAASTARVSIRARRRRRPGVVGATSFSSSARSASATSPAATAVAANGVVSGSGTAPRHPHVS